MDWFACASDIHRDPKIWRAAAQLGVSVPTFVGHYTAVLGHLARHGDESGSLLDTPDPMLEHVAMWTGHTGSLASIIREHFQDDDGTLHGWAKRNGVAIAQARRDAERKANERRAERERKAREREQQLVQGVRPQDNPQDSPQDGRQSGAGTHTQDVRDTQDVHDIPATTTTTTTTTSLPAPRKPRASRAKVDGSGNSWLAPAQLVWERRRGAGTFPHGEAAKRLKSLLDAGWEMDEICDRLDWYLLNKGMEIVLEDAEEAAKRFFNPSITMFWKGFALFDPKAASNATPPDWAAELAATWAACGLGLVSPWRLQHDLHSAYVACFTPEDGVSHETVLERGRARGRAVLKAAISEHASCTPRGGWKDFVRALPSRLETQGVKLAEAA